MTWASLTSGSRVEELLDLARVDVLAAADDHVLDPADDTHVAVLVHDRQVAAVHPSGGVNRAGGGLGVRPVPAHDAVAARALLAGRTARHGGAGLRDRRS